MRKTPKERWTNREIEEWFDYIYVIPHNKRNHCDWYKQAKFYWEINWICKFIGEYDCFCINEYNISNYSLSFDFECPNWWIKFWNGYKRIKPDLPFIRLIK